MRKWMRERLQRRKKKDTGKNVEPAPPPLQPAYFDAAMANPPPEAPSGEVEAPSSRAPEVESREKRSASEPIPEPVAEPARPRQQASGAAGQRGRGRRRRGGRGRAQPRREQAVAQAFAPSVVKGGITGDTAVEEQPAEAEGERSSPMPLAEIPKVPPLAVPRPPKGLVVLAIGLPGSGKSTWFKRHNVIPLSSDMVRTLLFDDVREQRYQDLVFSNLRSMLKARLIARRPMNYVDATNLTPHERQHWIKLAKDYGYEVHAVFFDVPLDVCIERHGRRDRVVPENVMRRMAAKLKPPSFDEGFAKITVVRVKKKEGAE
jgi:predicted kinase